MASEPEAESTPAESKTESPSKELCFEFVVDKQTVNPKDLNVRFEKIPSGIRVLVAARCM